ncbi:hypothetical protein [Psychromonas aquimarina]|uniref:hypothetical protein n=1 Tax=Psychromonas aquimarina TaxID=444919 RepID=UPI00048DCEBC|nr:hypothetical protein [Psychromonas aquimarina]
MTKYNCLPEKVNRTRRIIGRVINSKELPPFVYRFDRRHPALIRAAGFQPWNGAGGISMMEHVNNSYSPGHLRAGQPTKYDIQFVSCGAYGILKNIDPKFAQLLLQTNIYKIDTAIALQTGVFFDANDVLDKMGITRFYSTQREWFKAGGVNSAAIVGTMRGINFANQMTGVVAPDEELLQGWQAF